MPSTCSSSMTALTDPWSAPRPRLPLLPPPLLPPPLLALPLLPPPPRLPWLLSAPPRLLPLPPPPPPPRRSAALPPPPCLSLAGGCTVVCTVVIVCAKVTAVCSARAELASSGRERLLRASSAPSPPPSPREGCVAVAARKLHCEGLHLRSGGSQRSLHARAIEQPNEEGVRGGESKRRDKPSSWRALPRPTGASCPTSNSPSPTLSVEAPLRLRLRRRLSCGAGLPCRGHSSSVSVWPGRRSTIGPAGMRRHALRRHGWPRRQRDLPRSLPESRP